MEYTKAFLDAFKFTMRYEVGPKFSMDDPDVISGKCGDPASQKKTGYTCIAEDAGGETKFGIAKNANPDVDIKGMNLATALEIYYKRYWTPLSLDSFDQVVAINLFDAAVNHGVGQASKWLQRAVNTTPDGKIGPATVKAAQSVDPLNLAEQILQARENLFNTIVKNKPSQAKFLKGWLNRLNDIKSYTKATK